MMIYLDCAATSFQKPKGVALGINRALQTMASPGRGCHRPAMAAADCVLNCRLLLASFFNVDDPEKVIFTFNATHGLNIAINSLVKAGDKVVVSAFEHNAVMRPLTALGADICIAKSRLFDREGTIDAFVRSLRGAKCAVCTHVSNVFGFILPIEEIAAACRKMQVPLIIDASQSAGILPLDFTALGAAFLAAPGHKGLLGPQGTGVLLCNCPATPILFGGTGSASANPLMPEFLPDRLEAGTHNVLGISGLLGGLSYVVSRPVGAIAAHERALAASFAAELSKVPRLRVYFCGEPGLQGGVVSILSEKIACDELAERLGNMGICVRAGLHCAPSAHKTAGTFDSGTVRFSFSPFNSAGDAIVAANSLKKILNNM
ncbi:MAG: aminotransferase class V-fold PLP-dependent enzyme [Oscillospiraceae bacterium]